MPLNSTYLCRILWTEMEIGNAYMCKWLLRRRLAGLPSQCIQPFCHVSSPGMRHEKGRRPTLSKIDVSSSKEDDTVCIFAWLSVVKVSSSCVNFRGEGPEVFYLKKKKSIKKPRLRSKMCTHYADCSCIIHPHTCSFFRAEWQVVVPERK